MKDYGCTFEYEKERNADLMRAYRQCLGNIKGSVDINALFAAVVEMPSKRFWVSDQRATVVVSNMMRGMSLSKMKPMKQEMFREIYRRVMEMKKEFPERTVFQLTSRVVEQPAPKFYLTPGSAHVICYKIKRGWYEKRKRKIG